MKAYELLSSPDKWTRGSRARDKNNNRVDPNNMNAVSWCLIGSLEKCYDKKNIPYILQKISKSIYKLYNIKYIVESLWRFNDIYAIYEDVKRVLKDADV